MTERTELFKRLIEAHEASNWKSTNESLREIADSARTEEGRAALKTMSPSLVEDLSIFLTHQSPDAPQDTKQFVARAIGNLCFNNAKLSEEFRSKSDVASKLIPFLDTDDELVKRSAAGALANLSSENEEIQKVVVQLGGVSYLVKLLTSSDVASQAMASRALINVLQSGSHFEQFFDSNGMVPFLSFSQSENDHLKRELLNFLTLVSANEQFRNRIFDTESIPFVLEILSKEGGEKDEEGEEESFKELGWEILMNLTEKENTPRKELVALGVHRPLFQIAFDADRRLNDSKKAFRVLSNLSADEANVTPLLQFIPDLFKTANHSQVEIQVGSLLIIGNLVRSDEQSKKMAREEETVKLLGQLCRKEDLRVAHLALGVYRNLSIPVENKELLVDQGAFELLKEVMENTKNPSLHVQFMCTGILRSLIAQGGDLLERFGKMEGGFESLISVANGVGVQLEKDDDGKEKEKDLRVEYEAARNLVRFTNQPQFVEKILDGGLRSILQLVQSKFDLLQGEGLQGLLNIAKAGKISQLEEEETSSVVQSLQTSNPALSEMKTQLLSLLGKSDSQENGLEVKNSIEN